MMVDAATGAAELNGALVYTSHRWSGHTRKPAQPILFLYMAPL
jgi:hypothetical protein